MRRAHGLVEVSRRDFCAMAAACGGLAIAGCVDGGANVVGTGPLGGGPGGPDAGTHTGDGSMVTNPDGGSGATCSPSATDVGAPATFTLNTPKYFSGKYFVVRDSGGLYAVSSLCTHEGATNAVFGTNFRCPRHGALFTFNGAIVSGPVSKVLVHYSMCTLANGHVGVMTTIVSAATRLVA
jgi:cytochrome b6-f complex iron-sulfur subunit